MLRHITQSIDNSFDESFHDDVAHPLPAEEQLAMLFRTVGLTLPPAAQPAPTPYSPLVLRNAYRVCEHLTSKHSKTFYFSTWFLPRAKRKAVHALYAFCRMSDDVVDMAQQDPAPVLAEWVRHNRHPIAPANNHVLIAWNDTRLRYHLSQSLIDELLAGVAMDLTIHHYVTFTELSLYCYRVASVVGLLSMGILGTAPNAESYAIKLGIALQLTNILRDVGEDAQRGRVYLPQEDLNRYGLTCDDILAGVYDDRFRALMRFEIERAHTLYAESWHGIALLPANTRLAVGVAARLYRGILHKIVANNYDAYTKRAFLTFSEKIKLLPGIWHAVQQLKRQRPT